MTCKTKRIEKVVEFAKGEKKIKPKPKTIRENKKENKEMNTKKN